MAREVRHIGVRFQGEKDGEVRRVSFVPGESGQSLRDILGRTSARVPTACAGVGTCGQCRVRIDEGAGGAPTEAELLHLGDEALAGKTRLACQVIPRGDMDVTVLHRATSSPWRSIRSPPYRSAFPLSPDRTSRDTPLCVAVDVGTTHITAAACDASSGRLLAVSSGPNPQARLSADVIGRLDAARSETEGRLLRRWVTEGIETALFLLAQDEGIALSRVGRACVVGNSAMLVLLGGGAPEMVLDPAHWSGAASGPLTARAGLSEEWRLAPDAAIELVQPLGGFVGSDLLAGVTHCRLTARSAPALLVDFGTNSEIALWDGERLWATAVAGGPAFEAAGIGCGVAAEPGAIHHLTRSPGGAWQGEVLEPGPPRGICGSGLVDLLAILRAGGEIDELGRFVREPVTLMVKGERFALSKADVDALQRAKAAVAAGIEVLCRRAGVRFDEIDVLHLAGSFGEHLDAEHARCIGLLPPVPAARVRFAGNTALQGALDLLISDEAEAVLARVRRGCTLVNLSLEEEFEELFLEHLYVRPMAPRGSLG
jgi:uncharacterized 2Fe-2S/4Fe-4S cluster protein (DUF4445 family)